MQKCCCVVFGNIIMRGDMSNSKNPVGQAEEMVACLNELSDMAHAGLSTDGAHHKQWYLSEILKRINPEWHAEFAKKSGDTGVCP